MLHTKIYSTCSYPTDSRDLKRQEKIANVVSNDVKRTVLPPPPTTHQVTTGNHDNQQENDPPSKQPKRPRKSSFFAKFTLPSLSITTSNNKKKKNRNRKRKRSQSANDSKSSSSQSGTPHSSASSSATPTDDSSVTSNDALSHLILKNGHPESDLAMGATTPSSDGQSAMDSPQVPVMETTDASLQTAVVSDSLPVPSKKPKATSWIIPPSLESDSTVQRAVEASRENTNDETDSNIDNEDDNEYIDRNDLGFKLSDNQEAELSDEESVENDMNEANPEISEQVMERKTVSLDGQKAQSSTSSEEWVRAEDVSHEEPQSPPAIISNLNRIDSFEFPEKKELDKQGKANIGIAFSGGGARSASCTLGQLRALHHLGFIERTRYFSSVSGSSWTLTPFLYGTTPRDYFVGVFPEDWKLDWHHIYSSSSHIAEYMRFRRKKWINLFVDEVDKVENDVVTERNVSVTCEEDETSPQNKSNVHHKNASITTESSSQPSSTQETEENEERLEADILRREVEKEMSHLKGGELVDLELVGNNKQVAISDKDDKKTKKHYMEIRTKMHKQYFVHHYQPDPIQNMAFQLNSFSILGQFAYHLWNKASHYSYSRVLHDVFVKTFQAGESTHYFSWQKSHVDDIVERNPDALSAKDFNIYQNETDPFLIINGTLLNLNQKAPYDRKSHLEFTPLYVGCSKLYENGKTLQGRPSPTLGGVYVEPFGFNSLYCVHNSKYDTMVHIPVQNDEHRLSLSDVVACSSAAPAQEAAQRGLLSMFPRFHFWTPWSEPIENFLPEDQTSDLLPNAKECEATSPMAETEPSSANREALQDAAFTAATEGNYDGQDDSYNDPNLEAPEPAAFHGDGDKDKAIPSSQRNVLKAKLYNVGDGGLLENSGMMGLLKRGVRNVIIFLNTRAHLHVNNTILTTDVSEDCGLPFGPLHYDGFLNERKREKTAKRKFFNYYPRKLKRFRTRIDYEINHVFKDEDGSKYKTLVETLYKKRMRGESAMHEDEYEVLNNDFYGVKGGWKVRVLWVYNDVFKRFEERCLSPHVKASLNLRKPGDFVRYPHYRTVGENINPIGGLKTEQVNLLAFQHTYNIMEHREWFENFYKRAEEEYAREETK